MLLTLAIGFGNYTILTIGKLGAIPFQVFALATRKNMHPARLRPYLVSGKIGQRFCVPKNINRPFIGLQNANGHIFGIFAPFKANKTYLVDCAAFIGLVAFLVRYLYLGLEGCPLCGSKLVFAKSCHITRLLGRYIRHRLERLGILNIEPKALRFEMYY